MWKQPQIMDILFQASFQSVLAHNSAKYKKFWMWDNRDLNITYLWGPWGCFLCPDFFPVFFGVTRDHIEHFSEEIIWLPFISQIDSPGA